MLLPSPISGRQLVLHVVTRRKPQEATSAATATVATITTTQAAAALAATVAAKTTTTTATAAAATIASFAGTETLAALCLRFHLLFSVSSSSFFQPILALTLIPDTPDHTHTHTHHTRIHTCLYRSYALPCLPLPLPLSLSLFPSSALANSLAVV